MTKLTGNIISSPENLAVYYDPYSDSVRHGDEREVSRMTASTSAPHLGQRARAAGVLNLDWQSDRSRKHFFQIDVAPTKSWSMQNPT
jgi:hypothetical protein